MSMAVGKDTQVTQDDLGSGAEAAAARRLAEALDPAAIDALLADAKAAGTPIDGVDGLLNRMTRAVLERALQTEMTHHLGYDRDGEFEPRIVPKRSRRVGQIDEIVLSCYARGMSTRDIEAHLLEVYGVAASRELVSNITDVVTDEIEIWRSRPVDEVYPIVYIDGIADQGPGQGRGHHQVRAPGHRRGRRGPQARAGLLDRRDRRREVLALGPHPAA